MDELSHYLKPPAQGTWRIGLLVTLLALAAAYLGLQAFRQHQAAGRAVFKTEQWRVAHEARPPPKLSNKAIEEQKHWTDLKAERDFPWDTLFRAVERASSENIGLLEFQPDSASRRVILGGEAKDRAALVVFLQALSSQGALKDVHLTHQQTTVRDRLETQAFEIKATINR
jgi:hypothetical protein